ncbi:MAG: hypothetical protein WAW88_15630 [Nocardioides sp.]
MSHPAAPGLRSGVFGIAGRAAGRVAGGLGLLVALAGCSALGGSTAGDPTPPAPTSVALEGFDTSSIRVERADFCDEIPGASVERALDGKVTGEGHYSSGVPAEMESDLVDISHEFGCRFKGPLGAEARAWVFAPPVDAARAAGLVAELKGADGCVPLPPAPAYGNPTVAVACGTTGQPSIVMAGLFGDAWLTCSLRRASASDWDGPRLFDEAGRWCVAVVQAAEGA